jgi:hypothetical protein
MDILFTHSGKYLYIQASAPINSALKNLKNKLKKQHRQVTFPMTASAAFFSVRLGSRVMYIQNLNTKALPLFHLATPRSLQ